MMRAIIAIILMISFMQNSLCMKESQEQDSEYTKFATHLINAYDGKGDKERHPFDYYFRPHTEKVRTDRSLVDACINPQTQEILTMNERGVCYVYYNNKDMDTSTKVPLSTAFTIDDVSIDLKNHLRPLKNIYYHEDHDYIDVTGMEPRQIGRDTYFLVQKFWRIAKKENKYSLKSTITFEDKTINFFDPQTGFIILERNRCYQHNRTLQLGKISEGAQASYSKIYPKKYSQKVVLDMRLNIAKNFLAIAVARSKAKKERLTLVSLKNLEPLWKKEVIGESTNSVDCARMIAFSNDGSLLACCSYRSCSWAFDQIHIRDTTTGDLLRKIKCKDIPMSQGIDSLFFNDKNTEIIVQFLGFAKPYYAIFDVSEGTLRKRKNGTYKVINQKESFDKEWKLLIYNNKMEVYKKNSGKENK